MRLIDADALFLKQKSHADLFKDSGIHDDIIRRDEATIALAEILNAPTIESEHMQKPEMSEADRKRCEEWCKDCYLNSGECEDCLFQNSKDCPEVEKNG